MLNKILKEVFPILVEKCKTVKNENELKEEYMSYLSEQYAGSLELIDNNDEFFISRYIDSIIRDERDKWQELSADEVSNYLDEDESYTNFLLLSSDIFKKAKGKKTSEMFDVELEDYEVLKDKITSTFNDIREINRDKVLDTLSETLLDLDYLYGLSELESFRLSHSYVDGFVEEPN